MYFQEFEMVNNISFFDLITYYGYFRMSALIAKMTKRKENRFSDLVQYIALE